MLGHAQPIVNRAVAAARKQARRRPKLCRRHTSQLFGSLGAVLLLADELGIIHELVPIAARANELFIHQAFGHDGMRQRRHDRHVGPRTQRQMVRRLDVRRFHQINPPRINHDQLGALAQPLLQPAREHRVPVRRVRPDQDHHIRLLYRVEILRARAGAKGLAQAVARRRMAHPRAGVGVVVAKHRPRQLLHQICLFVGAARRGDNPDRVRTVLRLQPAQPVRGKPQRLIPRHFPPRIFNPLADHRLQNAVLMVGIAIGKPPLDARVPPVRLAVLVGHHAHQFVAAHFGLERTANPAIGAGRNHRTLRRADLDHRLFGQRRRRAGLHTGTTADAFRRQEIIRQRPRRNAAIKATPLDGQCKRSLHLFAGSDTPRTHDALRGIIAEIRVAIVLRQPVQVRLTRGVLGLEMRVDRFIPHIAQAHRPRHILQLTIAICCAGQTVQRVVRDV
ncbi:hypothetical protein GALL_494310 [mine drainage metagenome]|uniref:Uncharacterized protein n=1 Tax=mine drainage metagenome TaxID=410659 RepID=A0A1J5PUK8_9ZZZZ